MEYTSMMDHGYYGNGVYWVIYEKGEDDGKA